jgi:putative glycosyltransferase
VKLSIVTTLYRSAADIDSFHRRAMAVAATRFSKVEMVLVNDGSPDDSLAVALALQAHDPRVVVLDLARNFGHHRAMMTGLAEATGDLVFLIDSDLEEPPELLLEFLDKLTAEDLDVVYGVQRVRRGHWLRRLPGEAFFWLTDFLSDHPIPRNVVTARLMRYDYVRALVSHEDRAFLIAHLWAITGYRQAAIEIDKLSLSPTTYTAGARIRMAVQHLTTSSTRLLYLILYLGMALSGLATLVILIFLGRYATNGTGVSGWTSVFLTLWFFGGLIVMILGILGIYIGNILAEVKRRPYTHLRRAYRAGKQETTAP